MKRIGKAVILAIGMLLFASRISFPAESTAKRPPAPPAKTGPTAAEVEPLVEALRSSGFRFTPEVKTRFLAWSKERALAQLAQAGLQLPPDFLAWVDQDPVVAASVYGIADNAAARLVALRSLEIDLGAEQVRQKHTQLALGVVDLYARAINPETLTSKDFHLEARAPFQLAIPGLPCTPVNTHPTDRPLDLNDHIINFLAEHPVTVTRKVTKEVNGQKVETEETSSRPLFAYEVMQNVKLQEQFNAYMREHGQTVALDCGSDISPWSPKKGNIMVAYKMFVKAYQEKGLFPKQDDAAPTPVELMAYLVRNDEYHFPAEVKRRWPLFDLNSPWPVLQYLVSDRISLREREYLWERYRDHGVVQRYGRYIGGIAQYPDFVRAKNLQPGVFYFDTYPIRLRNGGVCGTMSNIGRRQDIALGIPACQASQPGHSCYVSMGGSVKAGFRLGIAQAVAGPTSTNVSGVGHYPEVESRLYPVNYGLPEYLDARTVGRLNRLLPPEVTWEQRVKLLFSGLSINPYQRELASEIQRLLPGARAQVEFWRALQKKLADVNQPGCPKTGYYNALVEGDLNQRLLTLPVPESKEDREFVAAYLAPRSDAQWLKYALATLGSEALKVKLADDLKASVAGERSTASCTLLSNRLAQVGQSIKNADERRAWAKPMLALTAGHTTFAEKRGKATVTVNDPCVATLYGLLGNSPEVRDELVRDLQAAVAGTRTAASCDQMRDRLTALLGPMKNRAERIALGNQLLALVTGHEAYAPGAVDGCLDTIYALGGDLRPAQARLVADFQAAVAAPRTRAQVVELNQRLTLLAKYSPAATKAELGRGLLEIIEGHEFYAADPKKPESLSVDPSLALIYSLAGDLSGVQARLVKDYQAAMAGPRHAPEAAALYQRLATLARYLPKAEARSALGAELMPLMVGHETYVTDPKNPTRLAVDPALGLIYALGADLTPARTQLENDLKATGSAPRTAEATALFKQRLGVLAKAIPNADERKAFSDRLTLLIDAK